MSLLPLACLLLTLLTPLPVQPAPSQAPAARPAESATQFYLRWRTTALNAKSVDEITPFWTADTQHEFDMEPASAKAGTLDMVKRLYRAQTGVTVVKETPTSNGATLSLEGLDADKKPIAATVNVIKEGGAWKIDDAVEQWHPKTVPIPD
jgi:hypothetical protein